MTLTIIKGSDEGIVMEVDLTTLAQCLLLQSVQAGLLPSCFNPHDEMTVANITFVNSERVRFLFNDEHPSYASEGWPLAEDHEQSSDEPPYEATHFSLGDGSDVMVLHMISDTEAAAMNENGDVFPILLSEWEEIPTIDSLITQPGDSHE